ncbi:uncharacterized protein LOC120669515 [Panicum virgatum]|uniref:uncharacterized protein LOC120669515 n=1 Tax=Panicum virgatum TaxID=38727 RepID=UPI0019D5F2B2|nr:uncharacterized protein LOC120669515 [Panicum virgatum]
MDTQGVQLLRSIYIRSIGYPEYGIRYCIPELTFRTRSATSVSHPPVGPGPRRPSTTPPTPTPTTTRTTAAEPSTRYDFPIPVPGCRLAAPSPRRILNPSVPPSSSRRVSASRRRPSGHPGVVLRGRLPSRPSDSFRSPCHHPFRVPPPPPVASSSAVVAVDRRPESYDLIHLTRENSYISSPSFVTPFQAPRGRSAPVAVAPRCKPDCRATSMVEKILQLAAHITRKNHIPRAPNCSIPPISLSILQSPRPQIHSVAIAAHCVHRSRRVVHRRRRIKLLPIPPLTVFLAVNLEAQFLDDAGYKCHCVRGQKPAERMTTTDKTVLQADSE